MNHSSRDAGIPLLTEVIEVEQQDDDVQTEALQSQHQTTDPSISQPLADSGPQSEAAEQPESMPTQRHSRLEPAHVPAAAPAQPSIEELEARAIASMGRQDWARLERALRERILRQLLARVDTTLEQHVRDSLADVLQSAVSTLADDIRGGLHQSLEEMIVRAVSQEIARLRSTQN